MRAVLLLCALALGNYGHSAVTHVVPGDGQLDGDALIPSTHVWTQCVRNEGGWQYSGRVEESLDQSPDGLRHVQRVKRSDGGESLVVNVLDRNSLAQLRLLQTARDAQGEIRLSAEYEFSDNGYTGRRQQGESIETRNGSLNRSQFNGAILGLPLSLLDWTRPAYRLNAFMLQFDAAYEVHATLAGEELLEVDGIQVQVRWVDVEWHHENGDVYTGGPDASGGRYWLLKHPRPNLPSVLRYQTDSYAVEYAPSVCPQSPQ